MEFAPLQRPAAEFMMIGKTLHKNILVHMFADVSNLSCRIIHFFIISDDILYMFAKNVLNTSQRVCVLVCPFGIPASYSMHDRSHAFFFIGCVGPN